LKSRKEKSCEDTYNGYHNQKLNKGKTSLPESPKHFAPPENLKGFKEKKGKSRYLLKIINITSFPPKEVLNTLWRSLLARGIPILHRDSPAFSPSGFQTRGEWYPGPTPIKYRSPLTVAGTAPDFHRIPPLHRVQPSLTNIYIIIERKFQEFLSIFRHRFGNRRGSPKISFYESNGFYLLLR